MAGVYELLEQCGCHFFYPEKEWQIIPKIKVVPKINLIHEPRVEWRGMALYGMRDDEIPICKATIDWMAKQRYNYILLSQDRPGGPAGLAQDVYFTGEVKEQLLPRILDRDFIINLGEHNTHEYLDKNKLFTEHPDWFSMKNGKRVKGQICYSNKDAMTYYAKKLAGYVAKNEWIDIVGTWPLDGGGYCQCNGCKDNPYAVYTGIKYVAKEVGKMCPKLMVEYLAYTPETYIPPKDAVPANMTVLYCPDLGTNPDFEKGWIANKTSSGVYQFEYLLADNWRARGNFWLRPDFAKFSGDYLAEHGFRGTVSLYLPIQVWWKGAFNYWFLRQSLWHEDFDVQKGMETYINAYYPGVEKPVAEIFKALFYEMQKGDYYFPDDVDKPGYKATMNRISNQSAQLREQTLAAKNQVNDERVKLRVQRIADYLEGMNLYHHYMSTRKKADLDKLTAFITTHNEKRTGIAVQQEYFRWRMGYFKPQ